jgi:hypothetical protein
VTKKTTPKQQPAPPPAQPPPPVDTVPSIAQIFFTDTTLNNTETQVAEEQCGSPNSVVVFAYVDDDHVLSSASFVATGPISAAASMSNFLAAPPANGLIRQGWQGTAAIGPFPFDGVDHSGTITVTVTVVDTAGHRVQSSVPLHYADCTFSGGG